MSQDFFAILKNDPNTDLNALTIIPEIQVINPLIEKLQDVYVDADDNEKIGSVTDELE